MIGRITAARFGAALTAALGAFTVTSFRTAAVCAHKHPVPIAAPNHTAITLFATRPIFLLRMHQPQRGEFYA